MFEEVQTQFYSWAQWPKPIHELPASSVHVVIDGETIVWCAVESFVVTDDKDFVKYGIRYRPVTIDELPEA
jgi:hypothetical protein